MLQVAPESMIGLFRRSCLANARQANHRLGAATSLSYCRFLISTGLPSESTKLLSSEEYINVTLPWPCDDPVPLAEFSPSFPPPDFCEIAVLFWAICCWSLSNCACVIPEDLFPLSFSFVFFAFFADLGLRCHFVFFFNSLSPCKQLLDQSISSYWSALGS